MSEYLNADGTPKLDAVHHADALTLLRALPDGCIDLIATDPPYFQVKPDWWDWQWNDRDAFIGWIYTLALEWRRVLKPNGSLYVFASPQMGARVEVEIGKLFNVLNSIVWDKGERAGKHQQADKNILRSYFPRTEKLIFAEQFNSDNHAIGDPGECYFQPIVEKLKYSAGSRTIKELAEASALPESQIAHYFRVDSSGWRMPDQAALDAMGLTLNEKQLIRERECLRQQYEELRRPFNITADDQFTDVWFFAPVSAYDGKHPTEKPLRLMEHIIKASSKPGAVVLDPFCGSGTTCDAARRLGRHYIGGDLDPHWPEYATKRLALPYTVPMIFSDESPTIKSNQISMFGGNHD